MLESRLDIQTLQYLKRRRGKSALFKFSREVAERSAVKVKIERKNDLLMETFTMQDGYKMLFVSPVTKGAKT